MNNILQEICIQLIKIINKDKHTEKRKGRPPKCSNKEYLDAIYYVLRTGIGWEYLKGFPVKGDAVRKKFKEWTCEGIFENAWTIAVKIYEKYKVNFEDTYIDASHIKNQLGTDFIGSNVYDRFRNGTKLTIIVDEIGVPISIELGGSNIHDIKFVEKSLENCVIDTDKIGYLVGDKGYISKELSKKIADIYSIAIVTPRKKKKMQKGKIRGRKPKNHHKLKDRYIVEHSFSWMKCYSRLVRRKDKKGYMFKGFIYFGAADLTFNKITKYVLPN